ncbi:MAG: LutC/YkgG family protein [Jatrophihabitans sp.]
MTARDEVLRRVRSALTDRAPVPAVARDYRQAGSQPVDLELFVARLIDYRASVHRHSGSGVAAAIAGILAGRSRRRIVVPDGFPTEWLPDLPLLREPLTVTELDQADGVLTSCAVAVAETGTIVLDASPGQGRRALSLVPDYHLIVVRSHQVLAIVPDAVAALDPCRPLTWISGPSATSDIELNRVEGVHGPRTLDVLLVS